MSSSAGSFLRTKTEKGYAMLVKKELDSGMATYIKNLPKTDLHVHLEGSIKPGTLLELADRNNVRLPCATEGELQHYFKFRDFNHFVEVYTLITQCLATPDDYALIAYEFGKECAQQNIVYAEVTFSMETNCRLTGLPWHVILEALNDGRAKAQQKFSVRWNWVLDIIRNEQSTQSRILKIAHESISEGVVAIGLTGPEDSAPARIFEATFAKAKSYGLAAVPHAGELSGPQTVWDTLRYLHPTRIGHGIRCIEDPSLVEELKHLQIPLEICITSNICLGIFPDYFHHPVRTLFDAGLFITICSDDPALFNTTLNREYELLATIYGFDEKMLEHIALNGAAASSLQTSEKEKLASTILQASNDLRKTLI